MEDKQKQDDEKIVEDMLRKEKLTTSLFNPLFS